MKARVLAALLALLPFAAFAESEARSAPVTPPVTAGLAASQEKDGEALVEENCMLCHDDSYIRSANLSREQWTDVLDLMLGMGMPPLEPDIQEQVLDYLEENHGPREASGSLGGSPGETPGKAPPAAASADPNADDLPWAYPRYRPNPLYWKKP